MEEVLKYLNNYFYRFFEKDTYTIKNNRIAVKGTYLVGQYIRLEGSILNDSIYKVISYGNNVITITGAIDEEFKGVIYSMAVPKLVIDTVKEIEQYNIKNSNSAYISESFEGYSYTRATNKNGNVATWVEVFRNKLRPYRKLTNGLIGLKEVKGEIPSISKQAICGEFLCGELVCGDTGKVKEVEEIKTVEIETSLSKEFEERFGGAKVG